MAVWNEKFLARIDIRNGRWGNRDAVSALRFFFGEI